MKNKKLVYGLGALGAVALIVTAIYFFTSRDEGVKPFNTKFARYISAYTNGIISKKSDIVIRLTSTVISQLDSSKNLSDGILKLSPSVKGKIDWVDKYTLVFKPEGDLEPDTKYKAVLYLDELIKVEDGLEEFEFQFRTFKPNFSVQESELISLDNKNLKYYKLQGSIVTADVVDNEELTELLRVKFQGKDWDVTWSALDGGKKYQFDVDSMPRGEKGEQLSMDWNGKAIEADKKFSQEVYVPAINEFIFLGASIMFDEEMYLKLKFSDPLLKNQDFRGFVEIEGSPSIRILPQNNELRLYLGDLTGDYTIKINRGLLNSLNKKFEKDTAWVQHFETLKPAIRLAGNGVILPSSEKGLVFPFEAVNIKAVDVEVIKIYETNILQFLQVNELDGSYELKRVGNPVMRKTISLEETGSLVPNQWIRYTIDLNELIKADPGALYRIKLSFRYKHSIFPCASTDAEVTDETGVEEDEWEKAIVDPSNWDEYSSGDYDYYYDENYWENRENPCKKAYYNADRSVSQNILASDIGIITKMGTDKSLTVFVTNLLTAEPVSGATVQVFDYQQQLLGKLETDGDGKIELVVPRKPYFIMAENGNQRGYLKLDGDNLLSVSRFDVGGRFVQEAVKGTFYGERGVWRPGDSIFMTFVLKDDQSTIPEGHPMVFEVVNPMDQQIYREVAVRGSTDFYTFRFATGPNDVTGFYTARMTIGSRQFSRNLNVATIKPNRLKIDFKLDKTKMLSDNSAQATILASWLHGAVGKNLTTQVDLGLTHSTLVFEKLKDFEFNDITKSYYNEPSLAYTGTTNDEGQLEFTSMISPNNEMPTKLMASYSTRVFEPGGEFSVDNFSVPYFPFDKLVGIKTPKGDAARGMLLTDEDHPVEIICTDTDGNILNEDRTIQLSFYKLSWDWWYEADNSYALYNYSSNSQLLSEEEITAKNGKATWKVRVNYPDWGRYLVRAYDKVSGHSSTKLLFIDWPGWAGRARKDQQDGVTMLTLSSPKDAYNVGEEIVVQFPSNKDSKALISVENGTRVISTQWIDCDEEFTSHSFESTADMTPNVYVHVTLIQPHAHTNDMPIRMYGILPIMVVNEKTKLNPEIKMPDVLEAEKSVDITVSEKSGEAMTYTLAMVDEGLLNLTRFKTPNPWDEFYAREALGVKTYDLYNDVIGAYGGELEHLLAIGGGDEVDRAGNQKANRFPPVVRFLGPFELSKGSKKTHTIQMPPYIGAVRVMLVAGNKMAYGSAEKSVAVRKPLMLLATLPRVLGPGEEVLLPVEVFTMEDKLKDVTVTVKTSDQITVVGDASQKLSFSKADQKNIAFKLKVGDKTGIAKVVVEATSGGNTARYEIEIDVRNPNQRQTEVYTSVLEAGKKWDNAFALIGVEGTNKVTLEVSGVPPINLEKRLGYLIDYPHGCIEQTTSAAFPQLYVKVFTELSDSYAASIERNVKYGIERLQSFQQANGGLSYWPGDAEITEWGTNYAGHFMIEAQKAGYVVPQKFLKKWKQYQKDVSGKWTNNGKTAQMTQAYRLYTLALAGEPQMGDMNRLREIADLSSEAKWHLAAAYQLAGKDKIASKLVENLTTNVEKYNELSYTFGSDLRDKAIILQTFTGLGKTKEAFDLLKEISDGLNSSAWYSTQSTAYALIAAAQYHEKNTKDVDLNFAYAYNGGKSESKKSGSKIVQIELDAKGTGERKINLENKGKSPVYVSVVSSGIPGARQIDALSSGLSVSLDWYGSGGGQIDPTDLEQGTNFYLRVVVVNQSARDLKEIALSQLIPAGWEIVSVIENQNNPTISSFTFRDLRDDRIYTYFNMSAGSRKEFVVSLNATYKGKYYWPSAYVETMYDATINGRTASNWVEVK